MYIYIYIYLYIYIYSHTYIYIYSKYVYHIVWYLGLKIVPFPQWFTCFVFPVFSRWTCWRCTPRWHSRSLVSRQAGDGVGRPWGSSTAGVQTRKIMGKIHETIEKPWKTMKSHGKTMVLCGQFLGFPTWMEINDHHIYPCYDICKIVEAIFRFETIIEILTGRFLGLWWILPRIAGEFTFAIICHNKCEKSAGFPLVIGGELWRSHLGSGWSSSSVDLIGTFLVSWWNMFGVRKLIFVYLCIGDYRFSMIVLWIHIMHSQEVFGV